MSYDKVVVLGGGTGSNMTLKGLQLLRDLNLTAIITMSDDGGSTGKLRDEYGVLPSGDVRQCLIALSDCSDTVRDLFSYRFDNGGLAGHNAGNILLTALEKITGSFEEAIATASQLLSVRGQVLPVTTSNVNVRIILNDGEIIDGEDTINNRHDISYIGVQNLELFPEAILNEKAKQAILDADMVVIGPGNIYGSILPNLMIPGMKEVLASTKAKIVYNVNLMAKKEHCRKWSVEQFILEIQKYVGDIIDIALYNTTKPSQELLDKYHQEGSFVERQTSDEFIGKARLIGCDLLADGIFINPYKKDPIQRTLIRHDSLKISQVIYKLLKSY